MKTKISILTIIFALYGNALFAHDRPVHVAITDAAVDSVAASPSTYVDFLNTVSSDISASTAKLDMGQGSFHEDDRDKDAGGKRSLNHFYDPLNGLGLSEGLLGGGSPYGLDSFSWASKFNGAGISKWFNPNPINEYSWQNARADEWTGLTATSQSTRQASLDTMFRSVGQVMHLLEDTSQPQHVRNEQHLDTWWVGGPNTPWRSPIEDYGLAHVFTLNYQHGILDWRAAGFTKLEDFLDRHLYAPGNSAALVADAAENPNGGPHTLGLAEWCNGNFLGARHLYPEYFEPGDISYYPYPSRNHSTDYSQKVANPPSGIQALNLKNGYQGQAIYVNKTGDGITYPNISRFTYFAAKLSYGMMTINDPNVLYNYHNQFIPKAVKYSAGLLDYFFRGKLDVTVVGQSSLKIKNTSGQDFKDGSFRLFYDDANGTRTEITSFSTPYTTGALSSGGSINGSFIAPADASKYILVYQGTVGSSGGTALDPVDAGMAIATTSFSPPITVKISLLGQVMLPDYFPDDTFAYADLALYDDTVKLTDLHITSEDYYDPYDGYYDTCGVASGYPWYANVEMDCGKTYDFILQGNACAVTGAFSLVPAGYMLEWQTPPSGPVVDNITSQHIYSAGSYKEFNVTLIPKRIIFTRDSIPPNGVDQTQAKLTFLTGSSGGWFTGNPQWSIIGDALGCTIDPNTGWIKSGTETGEITVQAEDSNSPYNYLRAALKIGSSGAYGIGTGVLANLGNALAVSLGVLPCDGSFMGSIRLKLTSPSSSLATPAGLTYDQYNTDNALPEILNETLDVTTTPVRQVLTPQGLADIVTISSTEYEIRFYLPEDAGTKVSGYYLPTGTPFKVWRVTGLATDGGGKTTQFSITEDPAGANIVKTFTWNAGNNAWTLSGN